VWRERSDAFGEKMYLNNIKKEKNFFSDIRLQGVLG